MRFIKLLVSVGLIGSLGACVVHERTYGGQPRYRHHHNDTATVIIHRH